LPKLRSIGSAFSFFLLFTFLITNTWGKGPERHLKGLKVKAINANTAQVNVVNAQNIALLNSPQLAAKTPISPPLFTYNVIASTQTPIQGVIPSSLGFPSINDNGKLAFTAQLTTDSRPSIILYNFDAGSYDRNFYMGSPFRVNTFVQVDDSDRIAFFNSSDDGLFSNIYRLDTTTGGPVIASGAVDPQATADFDSLFPYPSINNSGLVAFNAQTGSTNFLGSRASGSGPFNLGPDVTAPVTMFPCIADNGLTIVQYGPSSTSPLVLSSQDFSSNVLMATTANNGNAFTQFTAIGNKPGISHDGNVIAYMGKHPTMGTGIFAFVWNPSTSQWLGATLIGIPSTSSLNYRVGVNKIATNQYEIVFLAPDSSSNLTLLSFTLDISGLPSSISLSPLIDIAQVSQPMGSIANSTVQSIQTFYPVNTKGQVAFWVNTTNNVQMILRADPRIVTHATITPDKKPLTKDPVNIATGEAYFSSTDFSIKAQGPALALFRQYSSLSNFSGMFGFGWRTNFDINLTNDNSGNIDILDAQGTEYYFTNNSGVYVPSSGNFSSLVKNADGTFTLTDKNKNVTHYDTTGRMASLTDRNGNVLSFVYNPTVSGGSYIQDAGGRRIILNFDANNHVISAVSPAGKTYQYTYGSNTNLINIKDPTGANTTYTYDSFHHITQFTNGNNHNRYYQYDTQGHVLMNFQDNNVNKVTLNYQANNTTVVTDSLNNVNTYVFDSNGLLLKRTDPRGGVTQKTWDTNLNLQSVTDPRNNITSYTYDTLGNLLQITDPFNKKTIMTYTSNFNLLSTVTDALNKLTQYGYDSNGNLITVTNALTFKHTFSYDQFGNVKTATDSFQHVTNFTYDAYGDLLQKTDALNNKTIFTYDADGNMLSQTDARNHTTGYQYDNLNRLIKITFANGL